MTSKVCVLDLPGALAAAGGDDALVADALQALGDGLGVGLVVVNDQDADLRICHALILRVRAKVGKVRAVSAP